MVVSAFTIVPTENPGWYLITITSLKSQFGQTKIEIIAHESDLRFIRNQVVSVIGEKSDKNLPENLRQFMKDE